MALLFCDGFDHYSTAQMARKWTTHSVAGSGAATISTGSGRRGTNGLYIKNGPQGGGSDTGYVDKTFGSSYTTLVAGFAYQPASGVDNQPFFKFLTGSSTQVELRLDIANMKIAVYNGSGALLGTGTTVLTYGNWYYVELKVTFNSTTGSFELKIDGVSVASGTNVNTGPNGTSANKVQIGSGVDQLQEFYADDLYLCDTSGTQNNDFLGDVAVEAILPNGAGNSAQFTPLVGPSNYQDVDDNPADDDTTYCASNTVGQKDTHAMGDVTPASGTIHAAVVWLTGRKDAAGARSINAVARSGVTESDGAPQVLSDTYTMLQEVYETDPATGVAWLLAAINAAEFGYKVAA